MDEVSNFLGIPPGRLVKTLVYVSPDGPVMAMVAGDDELSESKLTRLVGGPVRPAQPEEVIEWLGAEVGYLGPHGDHSFPVYADLRLEDGFGLATGANRDGYHVTGLDIARDVHVDELVDLRAVKAGEGCPLCGEKLRVVNAIELGHIFKLGTKYSEAMGAVFLDREGREHPIVMGSYGIGIGRILAAAIEAHVDDHGIRWHSELAPLDAIVIPLGGDEDVAASAEQLYRELGASGLTVMIDDRKVRPGVKMKDADLIGVPAHVVVSTRNLADGKVEIKNRWSGERRFVAPDNIVAAVERVLDECRSSQD